MLNILVYSSSPTVFETALKTRQYEETENNASAAHLKELKETSSPHAPLE